MVTRVGERQVAVQSGSVHEFFGNHIHLRVTADDTGGAYSLVEYDAAPHAEGPPPHIHEQTAEYIFVLDGNLTVMFGSRKFDIGPGDGMLVPPGAMHTFSSESDERARFLTLLSPGGFEGFLVEAADLAAKDQWPPNPEQLMDILSRYDMVVPQPQG